MKVNKGYKGEEAKFFKKYIGKEVYVFLSPRREVTGKLVGVNTANLTLYIQDSDGELHVIPYSNRHVVQITFLNRMQINKHPITLEGDRER